MYGYIPAGARKNNLKQKTDQKKQFKTETDQKKTNYIPGEPTETDKVI